jgi:dCTP deaminase
MMLKADRIADLLETQSDDPLTITPQPNLRALRKSGSASVDLRLGTWFLSLRQSRAASMSLREKDKEDRRGRLARTHYIPFGETYFLHPGHFVLGATMEWIRFPATLSGYVVGKSSWGRRGLVIATAVGVHPGFSGCLTLEITNLGQMPIEIVPGVLICQLFVHGVDTTSQEGEKDRSSSIGKRRPVLGSIELDRIAKKLSCANPI